MSLRVGNCSGFYGDRLSAMREMLDGGDLDVLTGDYLAELTMLILGRGRLKDPSLGYARTFVRQVEDCLGTLLESDVRLVSNAGGLNPAGLALRLDEVAGALGLTPKIAYVDGDDLLDRAAELGFGSPLTANAYLGGFGIAAALSGGADIVVTGRVTDASLVVGPCVAAFGWTPTSYDELAGAVVAGHVLECGPQATGGNYPFLKEIVDRRYPGFPIAEVAADGSSVITKHPGTGGVVSVGTVTAQLLYEIAAPEYVNPDVIARFDTIRLAQEGANRVRISDVQGDPAPSEAKVAITLVGGYRNTMTMVITGLDVEAKARHAEHLLLELLGDRSSYDEVDIQLLRSDRPDATTNAEATAQLRVTVKSQDPMVVGRRFSDSVIQLALASYAGFFTTTPPSKETMFGVYWPALVPIAAVAHTVVFPDGTRHEILPPPGSRRGAVVHPRRVAAAMPERAPVPDDESTQRRALGSLVGARSGDKGGNANIGLWARDVAVFEWLRAYLTVERLEQLLPEARGLPIQRFELATLLALNIVVVGLLGRGVAASTRWDPQAKGLGEYLRSRIVEIPIRLLGT